MYDNRIYARPFIPLLIALIFGIITGLYFPDHRILAYAMIFVCAGFIIYRIVSDYSKSYKFVKTIFISPLILFFALGYLSLQPYAAPRFPLDHITNFADDNKWLITGIVDEKPIKDKDRVKFVLEVEKLGRKTLATGKIRVSAASENIPELSRGDRISFVSQIKSIRNSNNPGRFDYQQYMAFKGIWTYASVKEDYPIYILEKSKIGVIENFRNEVSKLIEDAGSSIQINLTDSDGDGILEDINPKEHIGILKALFLGDKSEVLPSVKRNFNRAGISHLLAISGLHIEMIAYITYWIFKWLLSFFFRSLLWKRNIIKKIAVILSLHIVIAYGFLSGMSVPTQRAIIMFCFFFLTVMMEIDYDGLNSLAIVGILILILYHPPSLFSNSFQLSFFAVFWILQGGSISRSKGDELYSFFLASLFAALGTLPFIVFYFIKFSLIGFLANFILVPIFGFIVLPLEFFSVFLYFLAVLSEPISMQLYSFGVDSAFIFMKLSTFVLINTFEIQIIPTYFELFCLNLLIGSYLTIKISSQKTYKTKNLKQRRESERNESRLKLAKTVRAIVVIIIICDIAYWIDHRFYHDDLRVTMIDVGQGSSALVEFPEGKSFLIDGGGSPDDSNFDVGERIVMPLLLKKRIKTLDAVILSHPDSDHLNGLLYILKNLKVKEVWTNEDTTQEKGYQEFIEIINKKNIPHIKSGELPAKEINGVTMEILYPPADYMDKEETWRKKANNNSLVVKITFGEVSFLFPGDIEAEAEAELVRTAGEKLKSTFLIAPHHGSKTSSTEEFLEKVSPTYVIISAGFNNHFNLPHPLVTERYAERKYQILRTDKDGAIHITTDGNFPPEFETYIH